MHYKIVIDNYIVALSNERDIKIAESEYGTIMQKIQNKPTAPDGYSYKLRDDNLEWELVKLSPIEPEPPTDEEAITRYSNELTGEQDGTLTEAAETLIKQLMEGK